MWLALSRSSTASRTESPDSGQWWRTEEFSTIQKSAESLRKAGNYAALEKLYVRAIDQARSHGNLRAQVSYLTALGNTYVYLFRYTDAIKAYVQARDLAHANSDWLAEGAVAPGSPVSTCLPAIGPLPVKARKLVWMLPGVFPRDHIMKHNSSCNTRG